MRQNRPPQFELPCLGRETDEMGLAMKMKLLAGSALAAAALMSVSSAQAGVVTLTFEGINSTYPSGFAFINGYYDGGMSSDGTTGPNYGITFSSNAQAICLNSLTVVCSNTSRGGLGNPASQEGGLFFLSGSSTFMNDPGGFTKGFSLEYVSVSEPGSVSVYSGTSGTGTLLATLALGPNSGSCPGYSAAFCPFSPAGVNFSGTGESIEFSGVANEIVFDDVTFGSSTVGGGVPEPATWAMMLLGVGMIGTGLRTMRRRNDVALTAA
jgi:hypothetical protein